MVASDLSDWTLAAIEGQSFCAVPLWRSMGLPLKTCHFLYFCSLSPDTHEMQWSSQFVLMFFFLFVFFKFKSSQMIMINWINRHSEQKAGKIACALAIQSNRHCILCGVYLGLFFSIYAVSVVPFQCNVLFFCVFVVSFFPLFPSPTLPLLPSHPGAAFCPAQAGRRTRKLPIWPCPWPCVFFLCHSHSPHL